MGLIRTAWSMVVTTQQQRPQVTFDWKDEARRTSLHPNKQAIGFVAQEIQVVFPQLVHRCERLAGRARSEVGNLLSL